MRPHRPGQPFTVEELEPRVMLSADLAALGIGAAASSHSHHLLQEVSAPVQSSEITSGGHSAAPLSDIFAGLDQTPLAAPQFPAAAPLAPAQAAVVKHAEAVQVQAPVVVQGPAVQTTVSPAAVAQFVASNVNPSGAKAAELTQTLKGANGPPSAQVVQDLQSYIGNLLATNTSSISTTQQLGSVSLGGMLQLNTVTLTVSATLSGGNWSGTVSIAAASATLFPNSSLSASITPSTSGGNGLTGTYTLSGTGAQPGTYSLNAANLTLNLGSAATITASNVTLAYDPNGAGNQNLAVIGSASVSANPSLLSGFASGSLSNFTLRADGFSYGGTSLTASSANIGSLFSGSASLTLSDFNVSFGFGTTGPALSGTISASLTSTNPSLPQAAATFDFSTFAGAGPTGQFSVTIGGVLELDGVQLTPTATGTQISAASAVLFPGHSFTGQISSSTSAPALTGTYTNGGAYSFSLGSAATLTLSVGEALQISATGVTISYNPNALGTQTLATVASATATSADFTGMGTASLTNFVLRSDGFSFDGFTLTPAGSLSLGNDVVTATGATLAVTNFNVSFGNGSTPAGVSGSIALTLNGVSLFPDSGLVTFSATSVTASYSFSAFDGTKPSGQLQLDIIGFTLSIGSALQLSAVTPTNANGEVIINPGASGNVPMVSISAATLSSPVFKDVGTLSVSNLVIYQKGFTLANAVWASPAAVNVGGFFSASSLTITLSNVALVYSGTTSHISGGVTVSIKAGVLFPSIPFLDIPLGDFLGTLSFGLGVPTFSFSFPKLDISIGEAFTLHLGAFNFIPTLPSLPGLPTLPGLPNLEILDLIGPVSVSLPNLFSLPSLPSLPSIPLPNVQFHTWGLVVPDFTLGPYNLNIGNFITIGNLNLSVSGFKIDVRTSPFVFGSVTLSLSNFELFPNATFLHFSFTNLVGTFDLGSLSALGKLSLNFGSIDLSIGNLLDISALNVSFTPDLPNFSNIALATISFPALSLSALELDGLHLFSTGFTVDWVKFPTLPSLNLGILSLPSPNFSISNFGFTYGQTLSGIITITSPGNLGSGTPSLNLGVASASATQFTASYNIFTGLLTGSFVNFDVNVPGFANLSAATAGFSYTPATSAGGTSTWLIGATGMQAFVGVGSVGLQVSNGTLALAIYSSSSGTTYALDASGAASLVGLPAGSLSVSAGNVELRSDTAGAVNTPVNVGGSSVYLTFAANTQTVFAKGLSLSIGTFASVTADFGFTELTIGGQNYLAIAATNVNATSGAGGVSVSAVGGSLGLLIQPGTGGAPGVYALVVNGGADSLGGVPGLTFSSSGLSIKARNGLDASTLTGVSLATPGGAVALDFSALGSGTSPITTIAGNLTLSLSNFVSITGQFNFQQFISGGTTFLAVSGSGLSVVLGTAVTNLTINGASLDLVIEPGSGGTATAYALEASAGNASLNGINGVTVSATNIYVLARQGLDVSTIATLPAAFAGGFAQLGAGTTALAAVEGYVTLNLAGFASATGNFGFESFIGANGQTELAIGASGVNVAVGGSSSSALTVTNASLSMLVQPGSGTTSATYALEASAASASLPSIAGVTVSGGNLLVLARNGLDVTTVGAYPKQLPTTGGALALNFAGMPSGSAALTQVETSLTLSVGGFVSLTGSFGFYNTTIGSTSYTEIAGTGITINVGNGALSFANTTVAMILQSGAGGGYALEVIGSTNPADASMIGVPGLSLTASNVMLLAKSGLDVATLPANLPTSVATPNGSVALNLSAFTPGTYSVAEVQGQFSLSIAGFVTVSGNFGAETFVDGTSNDLAFAASNVTAVLGTADANVSISGASLALVIKPGVGYDLLVNGGADSLNGVPDLTLSSSGLTAKVRSGLDPTTLTNLPSSVPVGSGSVALNFGGLGSGNITEIDGNVSIGVANFVSLSGFFSFTQQTSGTVTKVLVGGTGINAFVGSSDHSLGVQITGASFGLAIFRDSTLSASTYALQASTPSITAVGLPADITLSGSASLLVNTTGGAVSQSLPGGESIALSAAQGTIKSLGGTLTMGISAIGSLTGTFSFSSVTSGSTSKLLIGVSNLGTASGSTVKASTGPITYTLSNGLLGLVFFEQNGVSAGYALSATATATATSGGTIGATATLSILRNTTSGAVNETVAVGTNLIPLSFTSSQAQVGTTAYQSIVVSNASLQIDNTILISASQAKGGSPTPGASSSNLTDVTISLVNPTNGEVLFTISSSSAVYTTFNNTVTAAAATAAGLAVRYDGASWSKGDEDLVLTNVTFSIGGFVTFTAGSIDLQHFTAGAVVTDNFNFSSASLTFFANAQPMVTLSGSPDFQYSPTGGFTLISFVNPGFSFLGQSVSGSSAPAGLQPALATPPGSGAQPDAASSHTLGPLTLTTPTVGLGNFKFGFGTGTTVNLTATVTITVASASLGTPSSAVSATLTNLSGSFQVTVGLNLANLTGAPSVSANGFTIQAQSATVKFGSYLTLTSTQLTINPTATATQDLVSFGSLSATLTISSFQLTGSASNFAIEGDGSFLAKAGFAVSLGFDVTKAGAVGLPTWFPLQSASVTLAWADFNGNPTNFVIELSAAINFKINSLVVVSGSITDLVIDPNLLAQGQFPITSIGGASLGVIGPAFGGTLSGTLDLGVVRFDSQGNVVDGLGFISGTTTPGVGPMTSAIYGGIQAAFETEGIGFNIRIGMSDFGPLQVYFEIGAPVMIFPGVFLTNFRGGITFGAQFPTIAITGAASDALQLRQPSFNTPDSLTAAQWDLQLRNQVATLYHNGATSGSGWTNFTNGPMIIQAGAELFVGVPDAFKIDADILFDTNGKVLIVGTATFGDTESIGVKMFIENLTGPSASPTVLFLIESPSQNQPNPPTPPQYSIYGEVIFNYDPSNGFSITINGEADFTGPGLTATVVGSISLTFGSNYFNLSVGGQQGATSATLTVPSIQATPIGYVAGSLTIQNAGGSINVWGALNLTFETSANSSLASQAGLPPGMPYFQALNNIGVKTQATYIAQITVNTTNEVKQAAGLTLQPDSFSLLFNGQENYQILGVDVFQLNGTFAMEIGANSLSVFFNGTMYVGLPGTPIITFNANGVLFLETQATALIPVGFATKMTLTLGATIPQGLVFGMNFLLVVNTTGADITYLIPTPQPTSPPPPTIPTVLGPDYSSSNPLALTSYEITVNGQRAIDIPAGPAPSGLSSYATWTPSATGPYFIILGRGSLNIGGAFVLNGDLNITGSIIGSQFDFVIDADANLALQANGTTVFDFGVVGGLELSNAGLAGALSIQLTEGIPSSVGFGLVNASFILEVNTTNQSAQFGIGGNTINVPAGPFAEVHITGDLQFLGGVFDLSGQFDLSITNGNLIMAIAAKTSILGISFYVQGFAGIYYDSSPGIALAISLGVGSGNTGGNYTLNLIPGALTLSGSFELDLNTTSITRTGPSGGTTNSFSTDVGSYRAESLPTPRYQGGIQINPGFRVAVNNLGVNLLNLFTVGGSASITLANVNGTLCIGIDFSLGLNVVGIGFTLSGYFHSCDGSWNLTASAGFSVGSGFAGAGGSISLSIGSGGFNLTLYGYVSFLYIEVSITVGISIGSDGSVDLNTSLGDIHIGDFGPTSSAQPTPPQITSPQPTPPTLDAGVTEAGGAMTLAAMPSETENYVLTREAGDPGSTSGETILVTDKNTGVQETFYNVTGINAGTVDGGTVAVADKGIAVPVTGSVLDGGTFLTGSAPANVTVGPGNNTVATGDNSTIVVNGSGNNAITTGNASNIVISGSGNNTLAAQAGTTLTITGSGYNTVSTGDHSTISDTGNGGGVFNGVGANETYNLALNGSSGTSTTINDANGAGDTINLTSTAGSYTLTGNQLLAGNETLNYSGIATFNFTGQSTANYYLRGTHSTTVTNLTTAASSVIDLGSTVSASNTSGGVLGPVAGNANLGILGTLNVNAGAGTVMLIDDTGDTLVQTGTLTPTTFNGFAMGAGGMTYHGLATQTIHLGSGGNSLAVNDITPATHEIIDGGASHNDAINLKFAQDFNGLIDLTSFEHGTIALPGNFNGTLNDTAPGNLETVQIGQSLVGTLNTGSIGAVTIGGNIAAGAALDALLANGAGAITFLTVNGNISGLVKEQGAMTAVSIGGSLTPNGQFIATNPNDPPAGVYSAKSLADIGRMTLGGNLDGSLSVTGNVGSLTVQAYLDGTVAVNGALNYLRVTNDLTGSVLESGLMNQVLIGGSLTGSVTAHGNSDSPQYLASGQVAVASIVTMVVTHSISSTGTLTVTGNVGTLDVGSGAPDLLAGKVAVGGALTTLAVNGDISGSVVETGTINLLTITGSLTASGTITAVNGNAPLGDINTFTVGVSVNGTVTVSANVGTETVGQSFTGTETIGGNLQLLTIIGGQMSSTAVLTVGGNVGTMTIGPALLSVGQNMAGTMTIGGNLGALRVAGGTPGVIVVGGKIGTLAVYGGFGPIVLNVTEYGIQRLIDATPLTNEYPAPYAATADPSAVPTAAKPYINVEYYYEGELGGLANSQAAIRVTDNVSTAAVQFDLSLITYNDVAKFNLTRLDAAPGTGNPAGVSGIGNVVIEGDLLTSISAQSLAFFTPSTLPQPALPSDPKPPAGTLYPLTAGVILPNDNLIGVSIRDFAPEGEIEAKSIQGVSFGSFAEENGQILPGFQANAEDAQDLLTPNTYIVQANGTFRIAFADLTTQQVALFMDTQPNSSKPPAEAPGGQFDNNSVLFAVQSQVNANAAGTANIVTPSNVARGAATALVNLLPTYDANGNLENSVVQTIAINGDGAAIATNQWIAQSITSNGPLGDLFLGSNQGTTNVTAPSIFGSIVSDGTITGTIQTTGLRTDPITGAVTNLSPDIGSLFVVTQPGSPGAAWPFSPLSPFFPAHGFPGLPGVPGRPGWMGYAGYPTSNGHDLELPYVVSTVIYGHGGPNGGISGRIIDRGNLYSLVGADGGMSGLLAVQGNVGLSHASNYGTLRFGGIDLNGQVTGTVVILGQEIADVTITGGLEHGGKYFVEGAVVGNLTVHGGIDSGSALVFGSSVGSASLGTVLTEDGSNQGIVAALGTILFAPHTPAPGTHGYVFNNLGTTSANGAVILSIFTRGGLPLALDIAPFDLQGLKLILLGLDNLAVNASGQLTTSTNATPLATTLTDNFNSTAIPAGDTIWFSSTVEVNGLNNSPGVQLYFSASTITFTLPGTTTKVLVAVPAAQIVFTQNTTTAVSTVYNSATNTWVTTVPDNYTGNIFLTGAAYQVTSALPGNILNLTWTGTFTANTVGLQTQWQAGAAVYTSFNSNLSALGVEPTNAGSYVAGTPLNYKSYLTKGAGGLGGTSYTGSMSPQDNIFPPDFLIDP